MVACSTKTNTKFPFAFIDSKSETVGDNINSMELYVIPENFSTDTLKMFCQSKKESFNNGTFHYVVFFDNKENAVFPNNPLTAFYGMDEEPQKHIKAYYLYNKKNGFSKLYIYDTNSWEGKADITEL